MRTELFEINTPETLGVTPRYVLQHNAISRSAHNFSATAKKVTAMAMALLPPDLSSLSVAFTFTDFCNALGYVKGGVSMRIFKDALVECVESIIRLEQPSTKKGTPSLKVHHWFNSADYNGDTGICQMTFDKDLADFLKELKKIYAKINLADIGKLQSRYAIRIFELDLSYESLKGKEGNPENSWYFERTIDELRRIFDMEPEVYKQTWEFRRNVIEIPVKEINEAGIGVKIKAESIKKGRRITGFRFNSEAVPKTARKKRGEKGCSDQLELPGPNPGEKRSREAKENEHLKERYPEEFAKLYKEALAGLPQLGGNVGKSFRKLAAEAKALEEIRSVHGIVK
jgi:plasmid replication initiation protein